MTEQHWLESRPYANMQTIAIIKPDAVRRKIVGHILTQIEINGFEVLRMRRLEPDLMIPGFGRWNPAKFYGRQHEGAPYFDKLVRFMCSGPSIAMLLKRDEAIQKWRDIMGPWQQADRQPGTIRYSMLGDNTTENLVHGSDSVESFVHECTCLDDVL